MGSGSSRNRKVDRQIQVPSASKGRARTPSVSKWRTTTLSASKGRATTPSPPMTPRADSYDRRPYSSEPTSLIPKRKIHIPPSHSHLSHYASIWDHNGKV